LYHIEHPIAKSASTIDTSAEVFAMPARGVAAIL